MKHDWKSITVTEIELAMYVFPQVGTANHVNRPYHGFVFDDEGVVKDIIFSDGYVMRTHGGELHYLPKGSSYVVKRISGSGGCYAINFDADISDSPFTMKFKNSEPILKSFKRAESEWRAQTEFCRLTVIREIYDIIYQIQKEKQSKYIPDAQSKLITPAIEKISSDFTRNDLCVKELAALCNISEVYMRKIFISKFGITPKEYIINKRINHAKQLLRSGQFSVSNTAFLCGYCEPSHFSHEFKRIVGVSPSEYGSGLDI